MRKALMSAAIAAMTLSTSVLADQAKPRTDAAETKPMAAPHDDRSFAMQMAQHHRDGIAMADAVIANGANDQVKSIARRIRSDQQKDLSKLQTQLQQMKGNAEAQMPKDPDMERGMAQLEAANGAEADRLFLEMMIAHHASALMMTHAAMPHLQDPAMKRMADDMFAKQAREIGELQRLRGASR